MRLISNDCGINASYEDSCLCIIEDEKKNEYSIGLRNIDFRGCLLLATYNSREDAESEMKEIIIAGQTCGKNDPYIFKR